LFDRQPEEWAVPPAPARHICTTGCTLCWSDGVFHCAVHPQRFWEREVGN